MRNIYGKKISAVIILCICLCVLLPMHALAAENAWEDKVVLSSRGDVTQDGKISLRDVLLVLKSLAKLQPLDTAEAQYRGDADHSGRVTIEDAEMLMGAALHDRNFGYVFTEPLERTFIVDSACLVPEESYCYNSLQDVVNQLNADPPESEDERVTILFAPGVYREHAELKAPYVTFQALNPENEVPANITFYYGNGFRYESLQQEEADGNNGASFIIAASAHDFHARDMMFENSYNIYMTKEEYSDYCAYPLNSQSLSVREDMDNLLSSKYQTQGLALRVDADRARFDHCRIIGRQDTLLMNGNGNRVYYEDCYIEGTVDFIYGNGTAVFESCQINAPYHSGHITAASTPETQKFGFLFKECTFTREQVAQKAAPAANSYSLGRPWRDYAMVVYWNCKMDGHITTGNERWMNMGGGLPLEDPACAQRETLRFFEAGSMDLEGNPLDLKAIKPDYERILQQEDLQPGGEYDAAAWLAGDDGWNPGGYP